MFVQVGLQRERLVAPLARVQLKGRVRLHVRAQVRPVCERLPAVGASEGFLAGMRPQVTLEQPRTREGLGADGARVLEIVRQDVHRKGRHADVDLVAVRALLRLLAVEAAMGLLVTGEVRRRGVVLAALTALVSLPRRFGDAERVSSPGSSVADEERVVRVADGDAVLEGVASPRSAASTAGAVVAAAAAADAAVRGTRFTPLRGAIRAEVEAVGAVRRDGADDADAAAVVRGDVRATFERF